VRSDQRTYASSGGFIRFMDLPDSDMPKPESHQRERAGRDGQLDHGDLDVGQHRLTLAFNQKINKNNELLTWTLGNITTRYRPDFERDAFGYVSAHCGTVQSESTAIAALIDSLGTGTRSSNSLRSAKQSSKLHRLRAKSPSHEGTN
jgi:hypothetical protein